MSSKVIYSKRYPEIDETVKSTLDGKEETETTLQKRIGLSNDEVQKVITLKPNGRDLEKERFISLAKELSEAYEISLEMFEESSCVIAYLYMPSCDVFDDMKELLQKLIFISDNLSIISGESNTLFAFCFDTHDVYIDGKKYEFAHQRQGLPR